LPSVTQLSFHSCGYTNLLDPASFPLLSHLFYDDYPYSGATLEPVLPLLPQITSLRIGEFCDPSQINRMLPASTSLTTISIQSSDFAFLDDASFNVIKERLEVITVHAGRNHIDFSKLSECIAGSKVLKKVIIGRLTRPAASGQANRIAELRKVVEACKKKKTVELWKENFTVNGKVDLNADVVCSPMSCDP
jgi:hypothetical protein